MKTFMKKIIRKIKYKKFQSVGTNVIIKAGLFGHPENIIFGSNVYIGPDSYWDALGKITTKDNVIIGPKCTIWTLNHNYNNAKYLPYDEVEILDEVIIEQNVWIGLNVSIVPGISIGEGAIIGMSSVIVKDVPPLAVVAGNPAKVVSYRDEEHYNALKNSKQFYLENKKNLTKQYKVKVK